MRAGAVFKFALIAALMGPVLAAAQTPYWLRVFRLIGLACKVLGLLILALSSEPIYGPLFLGG